MVDDKELGTVGGVLFAVLSRCCQKRIQAFAQVHPGGGSSGGLPLKVEGRVVLADIHNAVGGGHDADCGLAVGGGDGRVGATGRHERGPVANQVLGKHPQSAAGEFEREI